MAKKNGSKLKEIMNKYFQDFMSLILSSIEAGTGDLIRKLTDFVNFKKKLRRNMIFLIIIVAATVVFLDGLGLLLGSIFSRWTPGVSHILVGVVFILVALAYKKFN